MHVEQGEKITREEFDKRKKEIMDHIDLQMPLLLKQVEEQRLITELEELRMRQAHAIYKTASLMAPAPKTNEEENLPASPKPASDGTPS